MDICPQTVLRIYAIFLVYPDIILHNPLFRQKLIGRNTVAISFPRFHPRILIVRDLLQYLSAIHSKCIHNKVYRSLLVIRQGILGSFQKCEPSIIDRIIFEIPEQLIYLRIDRTVYPRPAVLFKDRSSIQCGIHALDKVKQLLKHKRRHLFQLFKDICDHPEHLI